MSVHLDSELAISQLGDAEALQALLAMVHESLANDVPRIAELLQAGDVRGANGLLHPMKGFLPVFCRAPLCEHLARVEGLSKHGDSASVGAAYAALRPELEQLQREVASYLGAAA